MLSIFLKQHVPSSHELAIFRSSLVPPYVRKTVMLEAALPWLYLKGVSTGEMATALEVLVGPEVG
ncbi:hypothetical protein NSMM_330012 [Nitrosomonas mobilis]|uniref:Transposase n=1 Tax=Nitrosomonas mobilis TaxID=51642 RepID=A0A1G5SCW6_9PROT|nr:hypothetical protein NSMM_330012 [Nitrosomonas mobilis]